MDDGARNEVARGRQVIGSEGQSQQVCRWAECNRKGGREVKDKFKGFGLSDSQMEMPSPENARTGQHLVCRHSESGVPFWTYQTQHLIGTQVLRLDRKVYIHVWGSGKKSERQERVRRKNRERKVRRK